VDPRIALFGKIPATGDFVAVNAASGAVRAYDAWIRDGIDNVLAKGKPIPQYPIRFLFRDPAGMAACVGVMVPSRDKVGRWFPISALALVDMPVATMRFSVLPAAYAPFLDSAAALLKERAHVCDVSTLAQEVGRLSLPGPAELAEAVKWGVQALEVTSGAALLQALFGPLEQGVYFHGFNMVRAACLPLRGSDARAAATVLECHASDDVQLVFWLRLVADLLQWRRAPATAFWHGSDSRDSRLIIPLGAPDASVVHFLADANLTAERLWPTRTTNATSIQRGRASLPRELARVLDPPAPTAAQILAAASA
jgi:type VI secretion system ImpM family protein